MLTTRIVPCLDVDGGRVVKGVRFSGLRDAGDPAERARAYELDGADELVVLDVSATTEGRESATQTVRRVRDVLGIPLTVGGGVRTVDDASRLLDAGADKVATNTASAMDPSLIDRLATKFGCQCTVLALDARACEAGWELVIRSGRERTGRDAIDWAREVEKRGAGEIVLTSWDRDGTREGYDTPLIAAICAAVNIPVVASGGAAHGEHMVEAVRAGASAVLAASILHDGECSVQDLKRALALANIPVRP